MPYEADNIKNTQLTPISWEVLVGKIKESEELRAMCELVRANTSLKAKLLPYFCYNKTADNTRRGKSFESASFAIYDLDHLDDTTLKSTTKALKEDNRVFLVFTSPSGTGIKFAVRFSEEITDIETYKHNYVTAGNYLSSKYTLTIDEKCKDPMRACFLSYDRDAYFTDPYDTEPFTTLALPTTQPLPKIGVKSKVYRKPVVVAYNNAHTCKELLLKHGYIYGAVDNKFKSPQSQSGSFGVVYLPRAEDMVYSHHGDTDPLSGDSPHSAFDIFRILEHNGDWKEAFSAAEEELGMSTKFDNGENEELYVWYNRNNAKTFCYDAIEGVRQVAHHDLERMFESVNGYPLDNVPTHSNEYIPEERYGPSLDGKTFNLWQESPVLKEARKLKTQPPMPVTTVILKHLFPDPNIREYVINFIAATLQGIKAPTTIVLQDDGGTGKSFLFNFVLSEIFGTNHTTFGSEQLREKFNGWMENKQFLLGEEIASSKSEREAVADSIKSFLTDRTLNIRKMYTDYATTPNSTANMVICSNRESPLEINDDDRRINVFTPAKGMSHKIVKPNSKPWHLVNNPEWIRLNIPNDYEGRKMALSEATAFAHYLLNYKVDMVMLSTIIDTEERTRLIESQRDGFTDLIIHLQAKDYDWFVDSVNTRNEYDNTVKIELCNLKQQLLSEPCLVLKDTLFILAENILKFKNLTKRKLSSQLLSRGLKDKKSNGTAYWVVR